METETVSLLKKEKKLRLYQSPNLNLNTESPVMTQNNEEVQTDLLLMTNNSAQGIPSEEPQSMSNTIENTGVSEEFPSLVSSTFQQDNIPINAQTNEYDKKDKTCTKIMDDNTLRIYFQKKLPTWIDLHYSFQKQISLQEKQLRLKTTLKPLIYKDQKLVIS